MHSSSPLRLWILSSTYPVVGQALERSNLLNAVHKESLDSFLSLSPSTKRQTLECLLKEANLIIATSLPVLSLYKRDSDFRDYLLV